MTASPLPVSTWLLVGQDEILRGMRTGLQAKSDPWAWLYLVFAAIGVILLLALAKRFLQRRTEPPVIPQRDFLAEAIAELDLSTQERQDLERVALRARLEQPAAMLFSPANLAHALKRAFTESMDSALEQRLSRLALKLFGEPLPTLSAR
jgi:hypothetical protein